MKAISHAPLVISSLMGQFDSWSTAAIAPTKLRHCKLTDLPKDEGVHQSEPNRCRPITVLSMFWRAWSSAWIACPQVDQLHRIFHEALMSRSGVCAETQGAMLRNIMGQRGYACCLDFQTNML